MQHWAETGENVDPLAREPSFVGIGCSISAGMRD